ncbi:MAG: hypothetical protein JW772_01545 [Candidatus Diapherotrites archaeon]|nr:hypothetical protein [Candidatus Diapherotrites archaeon]
MKTSLLLIGLLVAIVALSGCTEPIVDTSACDGKKDSNERDRCYVLLAAELQSVAVCDKIQEPVFKATCYSGRATAKQDASICDKISNDFPETKDGCYYDVAIAKQDASICDKIQEIDCKDAYEICTTLCYAVVKQDPDVCENIQDSVNRFLCKVEIAVVLNNTTICDNLTEADPYNIGQDLTATKNTCYMNIASKNKNVAACDKIITSATDNSSLEELKEICVELAN